MSVLKEHYAHSYAMTCHRTQGSEYENVIFYLPPKHNNLTNHRQLFYTAITRAKQSISIVSTNVITQQALRLGTDRTTFLGKIAWDRKPQKKAQAGSVAGMVKTPVLSQPF